MGVGRNTLVLFAGDNGTPQWLYTRTADGSTIAWGKGTMKDTGARVPLIARWPGAVAAGAECDGLVDFSDVMPTRLEFAGAPPQTALDGISFAPVLHGASASSRPWVHSSFKGEWFVRDAKWKLRENGDLYNVSASPDRETKVDPSADTDASRAARGRLQAAAAMVHPANSVGR